MDYYHRPNSILIIFGILFCGCCVLMCGAKAMGYYKESVSQRALVRGIDSISLASSDIAADMSDKARKAANEKYEAFRELAERSGEEAYTEPELEDYFKQGLIISVKEAIGEEGTEIADYVNRVLSDSGYDMLRVDEEDLPYFEVKQTPDGWIESAGIRNVNLIYDGIPGAARTQKCRFDICFPDATFYAGNKDLFEYCMMADKGIYISGPTSSIVGNIYAGEHTSKESRDIETAYGEIGSYGGLNVLSTQVGIEAQKIVTPANINLVGSFVIFSGGDSGKLSCFAKEMRKVRGYSSETMYSLDGEFLSVSELAEAKMEEYTKLLRLATVSLSSLETIPFYYDSVNDDSYDGTYRKIISSEDVEVSSDVTGVIFTPGNVIIDAGCNVEGLILCGDRIYIQGNNNIVSNAAVVKKVIGEEIAKNGYIDNEDAADDGFEEVRYNALDYIGGLAYPGMKEPDYYCIPYQE